MLAQRLAALGVPRLALAGGIAASIEPWLAPATQVLLVVPQGDALSGALQLARLEAEALAQAQAAVLRG
jgi:glucosamine kinase